MDTTDHTDHYRFPWQSDKLGLNEYPFVNLKGARSSYLLLLYIHCQPFFIEMKKFSTRERKFWLM